MAKITIRDIQKQWYISRATVMKALKSGVLTGVKDDDGRWQIEASEVVRWRGEPVPDSDTVTAPVPAADAAELQQKLASLEVELREARDKIEDRNAAAEKERGRLLSMIEAGQKQLADQRADSDKIINERRSEIKRIHDNVKVAWAKATAENERLRAEAAGAKAEAEAERNKGFFGRRMGMNLFIIIILIAIVFLSAVPGLSYVKEAIPWIGWKL